MAGTLSVNPTAVYFRYCVVGADDANKRGHLVDCYIANSGASDLTISALAMTTGTKFSAVFTGETFPFVVPANGNRQLKCKFSIGPADTSSAFLGVPGFHSDTITITHDGSNGPTTAIAVTGWATSPGTPHIAMSPSSWTFNWVNGRNLLAGIIVGEKSNILHLAIVNTGDQLLVVRDIVALEPVLLVPPFPLTPIALAPGASSTFNVRVIASLSGAQAFTALKIISTAFEPSINYAGAYTGIGVTSANNLPATPVRRPLVAFSSVIKQFDTTTFDLGETADLVRTFDFGLPYKEKTLTRAHVRYEDLGVATFDFIVKTPDETLATQTITIGTGAADGKIREALIDIGITTEQTFEITIRQKTGSISITDIGYEYEPRGPVLTSN
jgi:hypothetical protein